MRMQAGAARTRLLESSKRCDRFRTASNLRAGMPTAGQQYSPHEVSVTTHFSPEWGGERRRQQREVWRHLNQSEWWHESRQHYIDKKGQLRRSLDFEYSFSGPSLEDCTCSDREDPSQRQLEHVQLSAQRMSGSTDSDQELNPARQVRDIENSWPAGTDGDQTRDAARLSRFVRLKSGAPSESREPQIELYASHDARTTGIAAAAAQY